MLNDITLGLFPLMLILGITGGLILIQPDLSAAITVVMLGGILFFLAGGEWRQIALDHGGCRAGRLGQWSIFTQPACDRITDYLAGLHNLLNASYHVQRSLEAIINGGIFGVGIGHGSTKFTGLPVAPTDSIFAVIAEETGLIGVGAGHPGLSRSSLARTANCPQRARILWARCWPAVSPSGLSIEAMLNMAVMVNLLPHAGNALPLISYGGSSLIVTLAAIGILLNIARVIGQVTTLQQEGIHLARLLICAGGTGGGVYPALVVRQALGSDADPVLWVGGEGGMEADLVQRAGIPFTAIPAGQVAGMGLRTLPNLVRVIQGTLASRRILNDFKPDVLLFTGGYVAVPMALAGSGSWAGAKSPAWCMCRISSRAWRSSCWLALPASLP